MHAALIGAVAMKWYKHDPSAALAGMIGLTVEERGAYYTLMDLQYARAPHNDVTDELVIQALGIDPRTWRRLKAGLMAKGKVHETDGKLTANRVNSEVTSALLRMQVGAKMGRKIGVTSNKFNDLTGTELQLQPKPIENLSNCKGREAPQASAVPKRNLPPVINYRDPGNDYRSPPRTKPAPLTDEQRRAMALLAAKTDQSTPRKESNHERPETWVTESHADADADESPTAGAAALEPIE